MFQLTKNNKKVLLVVVVASLCLVFSALLPTIHSQASGFTLPCTITTTGNAWDGYIAFDLELQPNYVGAGSNNSYLVVMDTNGTVLSIRQSSTSYGVVYNISPDTLMFQGEPVVDGANTAPTFATHFWNLTSGATQDFPNVISEHDIQYDPINNTFLTLQQYLQQVGNNQYLVDQILELDQNGNVLWTWNSYNHISLSEASPFNETSTFHGQPAIDFIHANSLDWDYNDSAIYLSSRSTDTFYKINETTGDIIWACGEFGNFTLIGANGQPLVGTSLWYGQHNVAEIAPDVFTIFNNDYDNVTNPSDCRSSLMEVALNETSMTAQVISSWQAPTSYWNEFAGGTILLPNGDFLGDFGDPTHQFPQNQLPNGTWSFGNTGAVFVEVDPAGQVVRTFTFPVGCYTYRIEPVTNPSAITFASTSVTMPTPNPTATPTIINSPTSTSTSYSATPAPVITSPTPTVTPTVSPTNFPAQSTTPNPTATTSTGPQTEITIIALSAVAIVAIVLTVPYYLRKRRMNRQKNPKL